MKYMLLIYMDEKAMTDNERQACYVESARITRELHAKGQYVAASPLESVTTATSLRVRSGKSMVTDGPYAETREQLGGFFIVDVPHLDDALAIAASLPPAQKGVVEVRPVLEVAGLPA